LQGELQYLAAKSLEPHEALNIAAQTASFQNYTHARKNLANSNLNNSEHQVFFTVYWYDRKNHSYGREVLEVELSKPLTEIGTKQELSNTHSLMRFRLAHDDHFVCDEVSYDQSGAQHIICKAVRVLRFMEASGLKSSKDYDAAYPLRDRDNKLPCSDHSTQWFDPTTGQFILIDEPYLPPKVTGDRAKWAKEYNWHLHASKWGGMYVPGESSMFICTDASGDFDIKSLIEKIDKLPSPMTIEHWNGHSMEGHDTFISPLASTNHDKKRAVAKGTIYRGPSNKTIPMGKWGSASNERRPNAVMSVESHQLAARLIKAVENSTAKPSSVNGRLSSIKSKLEDWLFLEHSLAVTNKLDLFYYGGIDSEDPLLAKAESTAGVISLLQSVKDLLSNAYIDCEPLRKILKKLDTSIGLASKTL